MPGNDLHILVMSQPNQSPLLIPVTPRTSFQFFLIRPSSPRIDVHFPELPSDVHSDARPNKAL